MTNTVANDFLGFALNSDYAAAVILNLTAA